MNTDEPEVNREYRLVRFNKGTPIFANYVRFEDGSGCVSADGMVSMFELDQIRWRVRWKALMEAGYMEVEQVIAQGLLKQG